MTLGAFAGLVFVFGLPITLYMHLKHQPNRVTSSSVISKFGFLLKGMKEFIIEEYVIPDLKYDQCLNSVYVECFL